MAGSAARRLMRAVPGFGRVRSRRSANADAAGLVAAGVIDVDWYRLQRPGLAAEPLVIAQHYLAVGRRAGLTPNPLFLPERIAAQSWSTAKVDPLLRYVRSGSTRSPHPLFDPKTYLVRRPEAASHPGGALGHFLQNAGPDESMPAPKLPGSYRWGRTRELLAQGLTRALADRALDRSAVRKSWDAAAEASWRATVGEPPAADGARPLVSVVMPVRDRADKVGAAIESVRAQTIGSWELVVVDDGSTDGTAEVVAALAAQDARIRVISSTAGGVSRARNQAIAVTRGRYVAFLDSDNTWTPDFLRFMTATLATSGRRFAYSAMRGHRDDRIWFRFAKGGVDSLLVGNFIDMNALVVEHSLLDEVGAFDESIRRMVDWDLVIRLAKVSKPLAVPFIGVEYDDTRTGHRRITTHESTSWFEGVLSKHLVDWEAERARQRVVGRVSIVMPTYNDWRMTVRAVHAVLKNSGDADLEVVVVDNGSRSTMHQMLVATLTDLPRVQVVRQPKNVQFALGSNLGFVASTGEHVVFLNNDTEVQPGWLAPLLAEAAKPGVTAVQPLLLYPDGSVQCAGVVFPDHGGLPVHLLAHHPIEDVLPLGTLELHAVTAAAMVMSAEDVVAHRGFDPLYANGLEDVDLLLRAGGEHGRVHRVVLESRVVHHESKSSGRWGRTDDNRRLFMSRWSGRLPTGDEPLWARAGFDIAAWVRDVGGTPGEPDVPQLARPFLLPSPRESVGSAPSLRWALKVGAPYGPRGDIWGDVAFADALARALRRLGQQVVIDRRDAHQRPTGYLDDVVLQLRGYSDFAPQPGRVNLMWVISHPDMVTPDEVAKYDRVFAASLSWSAAMSKTTGVAITPLLQATDPALFYPDRVAADTGAQALFVGSSRGVFRPIVRDAREAGLELTVHGARWEGFLDPSEFNDPVANDEVGALYGAAGVVLNDHWEDMSRHGFVSNRIFDAVAAGGRVVTDDIEGVDELFQGAAVVYRGIEDLRDLAGAGRETRFPPQEQRNKIAEAVGREHSFDARARVLLDAALGLL